MKIEIDVRPEKTGSKFFYGIRLHPETNKEMAELEIPLGCLELQVEQYKRIVNPDGVHYLISFHEPKIKIWNKSETIPD